jgi:hypothetical protein
MPPEPNILKFLLERRIPDKYREIKQVQHTHNAGALFQAFLKRMDDAKKLEPPKVIDITQTCMSSTSSARWQRPSVLALR